MKRTDFALFLGFLLVFCASMIFQGCATSGGDGPKFGQILPDNFGVGDESTGQFIGKKCPLDEATGIKHCKITYKTYYIVYDIMPDGTETEHVKKFFDPDAVETPKLE